MQVFPALQRLCLRLVELEVFVHVFVESNDDAAKIHLIQLAELFVAQAVEFFVVRLGGLSWSLVYMPTAQRRIGGDDLCARAEQGRVLDGIRVSEQRMGHGRVGYAQ